MRLPADALSSPVFTDDFFRIGKCLAVLFSIVAVVVVGSCVAGDDPTGVARGGSGPRARMARCNDESTGRLAGMVLVDDIELKNIVEGAAVGSVFVAPIAVGVVLTSIGVGAAFCSALSCEMAKERTGDGERGARATADSAELSLVTLGA